MRSNEKALVRGPAVQRLPSVTLRARVFEARQVHRTFNHQFTDRDIDFDFLDL